MFDGGRDRFARLLLCMCGRCPVIYCLVEIWTVVVMVGCGHGRCVITVVVVVRLWLWSSSDCGSGRCMVGSWSVYNLNHDS